MDNNEQPVIIPITKEATNVVSIATSHDGNVSKEALIYTSWKDYLSNITKQTTKENSITFTWKVTNNICSLKVTKEDQNKSEIIKEQTFNYDEPFRTGLLEPMLIDWIENNPIIIEEVIPATTEGLFDYKAVTENNDHLHIFGIKQEYANYLADVYTNVNNKKVDPIVLTTKESGISDTLIIVFTFLMVGIALAGTIFFTLANR